MYVPIARHGGASIDFRVKRKLKMCTDKRTNFELPFNSEDNDGCAAVSRDRDVHKG